MPNSRLALPIEVAEALDWLRREIDERLDRGKRRHTAAKMMIDKLEQAARARRAELALQNRDAALHRPADRPCAGLRARTSHGRGGAHPIDRDGRV